MHQPPQSCGPVRTLLRPTQELVERRRRELSEDPGTPWWPSTVGLRAAAGCVLVLFCISVAVGLGMTTDASVVATADPAYASTMQDVGRAKVRRPGIVVGQMQLAHKARTGLHRIAQTGRGKAARAQASPTQHRRAVQRRDPESPTPVPVAPATALPSSNPSSMLSAQPWTLTADGTWTTIVSLAVPAGVNSKRLKVSFSSAEVDVLPLDVNAPLAPGAIVTVGSIDHAVSVTAVASDSVIGRQTLDIAPPHADALAFAAVAQVVGPHLVDVGWTPLGASFGVAQYKIYRRAAGAASAILLGSESPRGHAWHDASVAPGSSYRYTVIASPATAPARATSDFVTTPLEMPATSLDAISGKGMFLYFTPNAAEANGYDTYDPDAVVARAKSTGISHIEVRMARGTFVEGADGGAHAWLNLLIDKAAAAGIKLIAWQVPRRASSADAATAVAAARYQTDAGNGFAGLALDIEDGENYTGVGEAAKQRMVDQIETVREAVGPEYLLVATVMSPALTHWTNARYPFARIAPFATVMQPMEYWHHFYSSSHHAYTQDEVTSACADSVALTRKVAGRDIPVNVAGQSDDLGTTGPPSPQEIGWCLSGSKGAGAIGQTFFDWRGTGDDNWSAIAGFAW